MIALSIVPAPTRADVWLKQECERILLEEVRLGYCICVGAFLKNVQFHCDRGGTILTCSCAHFRADCA